MSNWKQQLKNPPKEYRPIPFWSWNENLSVEETKRQIKIMEEAGIGGYFMHARGGLQTPYMGSEWMDNVRAGIQTGKDCGMSAWGYDENGWPSGFGDGKVNGRGEQYQQKYLRVAQVDTPQYTPHTIVNLPTEAGYRHFYYDVNPFYVDTLDPEVTQLFLQEVHERYAQTLGENFQDLAGFFTDEPQISRNGIPWSLTLPAAYAKRYDEELLNCLPDLFENTPTTPRTRYRFWALVRDLFADGFMRQIYEWCQAHDIKLTGHMVLEETLRSQLTSNGACMPNYAYFDIPGMDWLGRHIDPPLTPHQVASVAHQLGKRQILSETFAMCGWNVSFEDMKWILEWQMVRGVTLLCQHLEGYSLRGIRKRDYPASIFYHQPWWKDWKVFTDYASRIGMLLSQGDVHFDVLLLHAQTSAWLRFDNGENKGLDALNADMEQIAARLEGHHIPFHYGDARILAQHGTVEGSRLQVGCQSYQVVIVPSCDTLAKETVTLLESFVQAGGQLIFAGSLPTRMDGEIDPRILALTKHGVQAVGDAWLAEIPACIRTMDVRVEGHTAFDITATRRTLVEQHVEMYYFVHSKGIPCTAQITLPGRSVQCFDALRGEIVPITYEMTATGVTLQHRFESAGSLVLFVSNDVQRQCVNPPISCLSLGNLLRGTWQVARMDENAWTLDTCDCYFDGVLQGRCVPIQNIQEQACAIKHPVQIGLVFHVQVQKVPEGPLFLVIERPERYDLKINGVSVEMEDKGMYWDQAFRRVDITNRLHAGCNELRLTTDFHQSEKVYENIEKSLVFESEKNKLTYDDEIEAIYLVGTFGVAFSGTCETLERQAVRCGGDFLLVEMPETVQDGNLVQQGMPFFAGSMVLRKTIVLTEEEAQNRSIRLAQRASTITRICVNGQEAGTVYWQPYEVSLAGLLHGGENTIEIEIVNNLRNLLGPHHLEMGESYSVGPGAFFRKSSIWRGKKDQIHAHWNDRYCFVEVGIFLE